MQLMTASGCYVRIHFCLFQICFRLSEIIKRGDVYNISNRVSAYVPLGLYRMLKNCLIEMLRSSKRTTYALKDAQIQSSTYK